jgi:hypothetical protein
MPPVNLLHNVLLLRDVRRRSVTKAGPSPKKTMSVQSKIEHLILVIKESA